MTDYSNIGSPPNRRPLATSLLSSGPVPQAPESSATPNNETIGQGRSTNLFTSCICGRRSHNSPDVANSVVSLSDEEILASIDGIVLMSEELKTERQSQIAILKEVITVYERHLEYLTRGIHSRSSTNNQAARAQRQMDFIEPAGRKLLLFLTLTNLEEELNANTEMLQNREHIRNPIENVLDNRRFIHRDIQDTEKDFDAAYDDLDARDRDALEEFDWKIFDKFGYVVFADRFTLW